MIAAITCVFLLSSFFAFFEEKLGRFKWYVYALIGVALMLLAAFRPIGIDNDSYSYENYFVNYDNPLYEVSVEYSYRYLSELLYPIFKDVHVIFLLYAIGGVGLKFGAFRKLTPMPFMAVAVYICTYFVLHEFTQIRVGVSSGLLLFIIMAIAERHRKQAIALILVSLVFHYSSALMIPLLFFSNDEMSEKERNLWCLLIPAGYICYFLHIGLTSLPIPYIADKFEAYEELKGKGFLDEVNVFNLLFLLKIVIFYYVMAYYDVIKPHNKYLPIMMKMESLSLFSFTALSSLPVLSFRVSELYGIVEIILYCNLFYTIRPWWLSKIAVTCWAYILFAIAVFYNELIQPW